MTVLKEVLLTPLIGLSPIWIALVIGAVCWAARNFGKPTKRDERSRYATRRNAQYGGVRHG